MICLSIKYLCISKFCCRDRKVKELIVLVVRFEHREENRKDCLRTLYALIEEAVKADKLVEEAWNAYVKD